MSHPYRLQDTKSPAHDGDTSKVIKLLDVRRSMKQLRGVKQQPVPDTVAPATTLRRQIMEMSMFPNIYNKATC
jgi:hypothetical protein